MTNQIVSVHWLKENLQDENLIILDASPISTVGNKVSSHQGQHIKNSRLFKIKENFVDKESPFPNTVPSPEQFEEQCRLLGINKNSSIVVYDNLGIYTSPRVWWLFKVMGHEDIKVLDGGLPEWVKEGNETINSEDLPIDFSEGNFESNFQKDLLISYEDVMENNNSNDFLIVDARSQGRFEGTADEPRKHLQSGSIPNSVNIPFQSLQEEGKFKSQKELKKILSEKIDDDSKLVFSCGSGLTACIIMLANEIACNESRYLFDGSWTEYAERNELFKSSD